ncbi:MAG: Hsp20/alpha crystallin family protein [Acidimicrobiales bacterium]|nr:Hsp20/alpha crystallin family protein [Acidimicrobiales bacterium]
MLRTFDPFQDFDRFFGRPGEVVTSIPMDVVRHEHGLEMSFDLPGVDPESIDLTVDKGELTLSAQRTFEVPENSRVLVNERHSGTLQRRILLAETLDTDRLEATYDTGVLLVTVPVAETAKPRKVLIGAGGPQPIEAEGRDTEDRDN